MIKETEYGFWVIENDQWISKWAQDTKRLDHDQNLLPVILPYIKPRDWVIDAGAYIGDHTIAYMTAVGPQGVVYAFEPNPEAYECLIRNCPAARAWNTALTDGHTLIKLVKSENVGATYAAPGMEFTALPLDMFNIPRVNFLKLDIEGMEVKAIKGAKKTITRCKPIILTEINAGALARNNNTPEELINEIVQLGYQPKKVYESDKMDAPQLDLLFLPL